MAATFARWHSANMATIYIAFPKPLTKQAALTESLSLRSCDSFVPQWQMVARAAFWPLPHGYKGEGMVRQLIPGTFHAKRRQSYRYFSGLIVKSPLSLGINVAQCFAQTLSTISVLSRVFWRSPSVHCRFTVSHHLVIFRHSIATLVVGGSSFVLFVITVSNLF